MFNTYEKICKTYTSNQKIITGEYQIPAITLDLVLEALVINKEKWRLKNLKGSSNTPQFADDEMV